MIKKALYWAPEKADLQHINPYVYLTWNMPLQHGIPTPTKISISLRLYKIVPSDSLQTSRVEMTWKRQKRDWAWLHWLTEGKMIELTYY